MKRLLVISRHFSPSQSVGSLRPLRLVRRISEFGWEPYVLTAPARCQEPVDPSAHRSAPPGVVVRTVPCWSVWRHEAYWPKFPIRWRHLVPLMGRAFARLTYPFLPMDVEYPWMHACSGVGVSMVRQYKIDLIWSTAPTLSTLCVARRIWQRTGVPYVADFRDVDYVANGANLPTRYRWNSQIERAVLRDAAGVTYTAPSQAEVLARKHSFVAGMPQCLLYNWFDASEAAACPPRRFDGPTILYGGILHGGTRRVDGFFEALAMLRQRGQSPQQPVRFVLHGRDHHREFLARAIGRSGIADLVQIKPPLPRAEFLSCCRGADVLLLVVGHDAGSDQHAGAIPGKLYDYFSACRPILVVGPRNCAAAGMVRRLNRGLSAADDAPEEIADAIERLLSGRGASGELDLTLEAVREFEGSWAVRRLAEFLSAAAAGRPPECSGDASGQPRTRPAPPVSTNRPKSSIVPRAPRLHR